MTGRTRLRFIGVAILHLLAISPLSAEETAMAPFFVAPIETEVQRQEISATADLYALVNCNALVVDSKFNPSNFDGAALRQQLREMILTNGSRLKLVLRFQLAGEIEKPVRDAIKLHLKELCRSSGCESVSVSEVNTSAAWTDTASRLANWSDTGLDSENISQDRLIKWYPLRSRLSRMVVGDADFVVEIKQPFDGRQTHLSKELSESIRRAVDSTAFGKPPGKLLFRVQSTDAGYDQVQTIFDARRPPEIPANVKDGPLFDLITQQINQYRPSPAMRLARTLAFDSIGYTHSPQGGAPEKLIGTSVPNFKLQRLDGESIELKPLLAGRPALITFWGVACGPCCKEAPHLTELNHKYGNRLAIVAVNGYDESAEVVSRFVDQQHLDHTILLGGGTVANELYRVGAYPTTFWVNRRGMVLDYKVGFDSGEDLERRAREVLESP